MNSKAKLVESNSERRMYDMWCAEAVIDHPKHGRLYVTQGFGGMDAPCGGMYRWGHGMVVSVAPDATLADLTEPDDLGTSKIDYMIHGSGPELLSWDGIYIKRMMDALSL